MALPVGWLLLVLVGCEPTQPCDDYVSYMCSCHPDATDTGIDCEALRATYADAKPSVQDECAILQDEQEGRDQAAGLECSG